jgi:apolipoprotein N-acyltransferase
MLSSTLNSDRGARLGAACASGGLAGALLASAQLVPGLGPLCLVGLTPLLAQLDRGLDPRRAAAVGYVFGLIFFGVGWLWIPFIPVPGWFVPLAFPAYVAVLSLALAAFAACLALLRRRGRALALVAAPGLWVLLELGRSQGDAGLPLLYLGHALADHPALIQLAAIGGAPLLSLWVVAVNASLVASRGSPLRMALVAVAGIGLPAAGGQLWIQSAAPETVEGAAAVRVGAVQPEIPHPERHARPYFDANLRRLLSLSDEAASGGADLVVWPESAFERQLSAGGDPLLSTIGNSYDVPILTGVRRRGHGDAVTRFNSAVLLRAGGEIELVADKVKPVPMYEAEPSSPLSRALAGLGLWRGRYVAGREPGLFELQRRDEDPLTVGVLICFDSIYAELARDLRRRGANLLVEISNRAQTGPWSTRPHALAARLRAVETAMPLVRVGNAGPTEWIDARGRVRSSLLAGRPAAGSAALLPAGDPTFYARYGEGPTLALGALAPLLFGLLRRRPTRFALRSAEGSDYLRGGDKVNGLIASLRKLPIALAVLALLGSGNAAHAVDGYLVDPGDPTYFEAQVGTSALAPTASPDDGLPSALYLSDSDATVEYSARAAGPSSLEWQVKLAGLERRHEKIDAVYQVILVLPLPVDAEGRDAFTPLEWAIKPREGKEGASVPFIYAGEKVTLKRKTALERSLLPGLVDGGGAPDSLPSLAGTGYGYTLWDALIRYDAGYGDTITGWGSFRYSTDASVPAPDAESDALKAYLITWIPSFDPGIKPFAIRMDLIPPE